MGRPKGSKNGQYLVKIKSCIKCNKEFVANYANSCKVRFCSFSCSNSLKRGRLGKKGSEKQRLSVSSRTGERHQRWIYDRTKIVGRHNRNFHDPEYKQWRKNVYSRDGYKCKINNAECNGKIEAHHILRWKDYPELRYDVNNGITLCHHHHPLKVKEERALIPTFQRLLTLT